MKPLNWVFDSESAKYMRTRQEQNLIRSISNPNEEWAAKRLSETGLNWTRQSLHGKRIFDFWNHELGIAVEIDGPEHSKNYDEYRDEYNFRRSGIVVLRVKNLNEIGMDSAIKWIQSAEPRYERKLRLRITGNKKERRRLSCLPYPPQLHKYFIAENSLPKEYQ